MWESWVAELGGGTLLLIVGIMFWVFMRRLLRLTPVPWVLRENFPVATLVVLWVGVMAFGTGFVIDAVAGGLPG